MNMASVVPLPCMQPNCSELFVDLWDPSFTCAPTQGHLTDSSIPRPLRLVTRTVRIMFVFVYVLVVEYQRNNLIVCSNLCHVPFFVV